MKKAIIAALALILGASAVARADQVIVLNSEEASYSILSRGLRAEFYWAAANRDLGFDKLDIQDRGIHFQVGYQTQF